jgi:hypothetical protein
MPHLLTSQPLSSNINNSTLNTRIELTIADLNQQDQPNIRGTAKKFDLVESTVTG